MAYFVGLIENIPFGVDVTDEVDNDNIPLSINVTDEVDSGVNIPISINVTDEVDNDSIPIGVDVDVMYKNVFGRCPIGVDVVPLNYFNSMDGITAIDGVPITSIPAPTYYEQVTKLYGGVKIVCPELGQTYYVPCKDLLDLKVEWEKNNPIRFSMELNNFERDYTKNSGNFWDLFTKGEWSALRKTRKYVYASIMTVDGYGNKVIKHFPKLVITGVTGDLRLTIQGIDRITSLIYRKKSWDAFCGRDMCSQIGGGYQSSSESSSVDEVSKVTTGIFKAVNLTNQYYNKFKNSRFLINYIEAVLGVNFTYDDTEKTYTLMQEKPESYSVVAINPMSAKKLIKTVLERSAEEVYDLLDIKDEIPCNIMSRDYWIENTIQTNNNTAIDIIEEILQAIVGVWKIVPTDTDLIFQTQNAVLADEISSTCDFVIPEKLTRSVNITDNGSNIINTINVIRPAIVETSYKEVIPSATSG